MLIPTDREIEKKFIYLIKTHRTIHWFLFRIGVGKDRIMPPLRESKEFVERMTRGGRRPGPPGLQG